MTQSIPTQPMAMMMTRLRSVFAVAAVAVSATACSTDSLLQVDRPDIIDPAKLVGALGATALYNGAIGDVAYSQGAFSGVMLASSLFSDEFRFGGTPPKSGSSTSATSRSRTRSRSRSTSISTGAGLPRRRPPSPWPPSTRPISGSAR